jgi:hypothetical protein
MAKNPKPGANKKPRTKKDPKAPKSAAKPAAASAAPSAGSANLKHEFKLPNPSDTVALVRRLESKAADVREITKAMGEDVAKGVENKHFDKKALGITRSLYRQSISAPAAFARTLAHLLAYIDDLGLDKVAEQNQGMNLEGGEPAPIPSTGASAPHPAPETGEDDKTGDRVPAAPAATKGLTVVPKGETETAPGDQVPSPSKADAA